MANNKVDRRLVVEALIKHETLTIDDLGKKEFLGIVPDTAHLQFLLYELVDSAHLELLPGVVPATFTITKKGIDEGIRLRAVTKLRVVR